MGLRPDELGPVAETPRRSRSPRPTLFLSTTSRDEAVSTDGALAEESSDLEAGGRGARGTDGAVEPGEDTTANRAGKMAFLVVVDGVTDPQNLGALLRSAECAGVTGVVLPRHRSAHVTPTVTKVAAGAVEHVSIAVVPGVPGALQELERLGVWTVGLDERGSEPVFNLGTRGPAGRARDRRRGTRPVRHFAVNAATCSPGSLCTAPSTRSTSRRREPSPCSRSRASVRLEQAEPPEHLGSRTTQTGLATEAASAGRPAHRPALRRYRDDMGT